MIGADQAKLAVANPVADDYFGESVSLPGDTALVGADRRRRRRGTWNDRCERVAGTPVQDGYGCTLRAQVGGSTGGTVAAGLE
jgi:hypothetical protein